MNGTRAKGIQASWYYPSTTKFTSHAKTLEAHRHPLLQTEAVAAREVTMPLYPTIRYKQISSVVDSIAVIDRVSY